MVFGLFDHCINSASCKAFAHSTKLWHPRSAIGGAPCRGRFLYIRSMSTRIASCAHTKQTATNPQKMRLPPHHIPKPHKTPGSRSPLLLMVSSTTVISVACQRRPVLTPVVSGSPFAGTKQLTHLASYPPCTHHQPANGPIATRANETRPTHATACVQSACHLIIAVARSQ